MAANRVTPSPEFEEGVPLEPLSQSPTRHQAPTQEPGHSSHQADDNIQFGDQTDNVSPSWEQSRPHGNDDQEPEQDEGHLGLAPSSPPGVPSPEPPEQGTGHGSPSREDTGLDSLQEGSLNLDEPHFQEHFTKEDGREMYTPALPHARPEGISSPVYKEPSPPRSPSPGVAPSPGLPPPPIIGGAPESRDWSRDPREPHASGYSGHQSPSYIVTNKVAPASEDVVRWAQRSNSAQRIEEMKQERVIGADENTDGAGCCGWILTIFSLLLILITLPFSLVLCIKVVQEYERAVIFRLGRLPSGGAKGPGIFFIIPCIESYTKVDLRTVSFDVPPQEVLTKDSVTVSVDAVVYYRVSNPTVSVANVENAHHSTRLLAQTTLRNILGTKNMSEILSDRESISHGMQSTLDEATDRWGIKVERVEIKDVRLPVQLQRAMAAEAEAAREARAKVIAAEGEHKASRALRDAAEVMGSSGAALQLRYLQTLNSISAEKNSTIIFPLPVDILQHFMKKR